MYKKLLLATLFIACQAFAQQKEDKPKNWDVNNPHENWLYNTFQLICAF